MSHQDSKNEYPNFRLELENYRKHKESFFVGIDEVGRGSWAGPLVVCCCWIDPKKINLLPSNINDSKKLTYSKRLQIYNNIKGIVMTGVSLTTSFEIDKYGLTYSNNLAIRRSLHCLISAICIKKNFNKISFSFCLDGKIIPELEKIKHICKLPSLPSHRIKSVIKGDSKILSISLASIVAKVTRDFIMKNYHRTFPDYNFDKNFGYGTKYHLKSINLKGITEIHRKSFKPIATICS